MHLTKLKRWREAQGYTQKEVASAANLNERTIINAEHGSDVRPNNARKIAAAVGVSVRDLIDNPPAPVVSVDKWDAAKIVEEGHV